MVKEQLNILDLTGKLITSKTINANNLITVDVSNILTEIIFLI